MTSNTTRENLPQPLSKAPIYEPVWTPSEVEHLHPYILDPVLEDKCHGKKQIHTRAKDPDRAGINQNQHKHGRTVPQAHVHPQTFHNWKQRFMESGKAGLSQSGKKDPIKTMKKREEDYKRLIGELTIANDILKKTWEESRD